MAQGGRSIAGVVRLLRGGLSVLLLPAACAGGAPERGRRPAVIEARDGATVQAEIGDVVVLERLDPGPQAPSAAAKMEVLVRERGAAPR